MASRRHLRGLLLADVLLGHREIALADFDAVDLGDHRVALRPRRAERQHREQRGGDQAERARAQGGEPRPDGRGAEVERQAAVMAILVVLCAAKIGAAAATCRAIALGLAMAECGRLLNVGVIAYVADLNAEKPQNRAN